VPLTISSRNARFQQWQALLGNRQKRHRAGEFLVQGVRPISMALRFDWPVRALLFDSSRSLSSWALSVLSSSPAPQYALTADLMAELGDRDDPPEVLAVVAMPPDDFARLPAGGLAVVFDRPTSPGNIGTLIRSADAFGAGSVLVTGHAADPYDPRSVRASAGSLFALPVVRAAAPTPVLDWLACHPARPRLIATDEHGTVDVADADLTGPVVLLIGNETNGLAAAWRSACDVTVRIPMVGSASSLNAAAAATVMLYEAARQRRQ
jgi:tRNA G18 (ribose-2'-O)-methylase SpoU